MVHLTAAHNQISTQLLRLLKNYHQHDFLELANREGVSNYLYACLKQSDQGSLLPPNIFVEMEKNYLFNTGRNMILSRCLEEFCRRLDAAYISTLVMRGAAFAGTLYPDMGMRPMIDMDLVIHEQDLQKVLELANEAGFTYDENYPYFLTRDDVYIDLHIDEINFWRLKSWPSVMRLSNVYIWNNTVSYRGLSHVRVLNVYDAVLSCCDHLQRHSFERLMWFVDVAEMIHQEDPFNWKRLFENAEAARMQKPLFFVMAYLDHHGLIDIPEHVYHQLSRCSLNNFERRTLKKLLSDQRRLISGGLLSYFAIEGFSKRMDFLKNAILIKPEHFPLIKEKVTMWDYIVRFAKLTKNACKGYIC